MKIKVINGGFLYKNVFYTSDKITEALKDSECEGIDYTEFCPKDRVIYDPQQQTADFIMENKRCYVFNGMGTGKTMSTLFAILSLARMNKDYRVLVISSKTVIASAWVPEIKQVCPWFNFVICEGTPKKKKEIIEDENNKFVGISADSLHFVPKGAFDMLVCDEATLFKSAQIYGGSDRGKNMCELASDPRTDRLVLLTGTPRPHSVMDAYGIYCVMNDKQRKTNIRTKNYEKKVCTKAEFRNALCVPMDFRTYAICKGYKTEEQWNKWKYYTCGGIFANESLEEFRKRLNHCSRDAKNIWIERPNSNEILLSLLDPAIAFDSESNLDLPDCPIIDVNLNMSEEDKATLNKMKKDMIMDFQETKDIISNKMVLEGKMEQINCGLVYDSEGNGRIMLSSVYNDALKFILSRVQALPKDKSLVIVSRYNHILWTVFRAIEIILGKGTVNFINGGVSSKLRTQYVEEFQNYKVRILLANTTCLSHGVTLTHAKEMIMLDTPQYTEPYVQVKGRVHRRGQKWEIPIYRLISNATVRRRFDILDGAEERDEDFVKLVTSEE